MSYNQRINNNEYLSKQYREKKKDMIINLINSYHLRCVMPPKLHDISSKNLSSPTSKIVELKYPQVQTNLKNPRNSAERLIELRRKFILTAKKYIGIPYGKKYLENHPFYSGNLFLDCCGLIRYIVYLLREDFGFCFCRRTLSRGYPEIQRVPFAFGKDADDRVGFVVSIC